MCVVVLIMAACTGPSPNPSPKPPVTGGPLPTGLATVPPGVTPTAEAPAARVNGEVISLAAYRRALARCEAAELALGHDPAQAGCGTRVLDELIERVLIRDEAQKMNLAVSDDEVNAQIEQMKSESGPAKFEQWLADNQYADEAELREDLRAQILGGLVFQQITGSVPQTAEQVHARHILVATEAEAQNILTQLQAGADFAQLAQQYSLDESTRATGGDLGFFYRGLLTVPEVEEAAFALQPGQLSGVVKSARGFHIVQVLERDPQHPLSPDDLQRIRQQSFERWLSDLWAKAKVEKFV